MRITFDVGNTTYIVMETGVYMRTIPRKFGKLHMF